MNNLKLKNHFFSDGVWNEFEKTLISFCQFTVCYGYNNNAEPYQGYYNYHNQVNSPQTNYLIQNNTVNQGNSPISGNEEDASAQMAHATRASPATIQWLVTNYETADGTSLPRCTLYNHYIKHCNEHKIEPVNAASFGKLIRSVFLGLRTRRLGTRGNSKYHYYGIRIKPDSQLAKLSTKEEEATRATRGSGTRSKRQQSSTTTTTNTTNTTASSPLNNGSSINSNNNSFNIRRSDITNYSSNYTKTAIQHKRSLSDDYNSDNSDDSLKLLIPSPEGVKRDITNHFSIFKNNNTLSQFENGFSNDVLMMDREFVTSQLNMYTFRHKEMPHIPFPSLDDLKEYMGSYQLTPQNIFKFLNSYTTIFQSILETIQRLNFNSIPQYLQNFWHISFEIDDSEDIENIKQKNDREKDTYNLNVCHRICNIPIIQNYIYNFDILFYQTLIETLIPNILCNTMTGTVATFLRNFAKSLENHISNAFKGCVEQFLQNKIITVRMFSTSLRRYVSINHVAQAARSVFQKPDQIRQMYFDYSRVDLDLIHEHAGWVCCCDYNLVRNIESDFKSNMGKQKTLEEWAEWIEAVVDQCLANCHDKPIKSIIKAAKSLLLEWNFYASAVIRDLTLRSAQSFGSFHLVRLLFDDYIYLMVEQKIARTINVPPISVSSNAILTDAFVHNFNYSITTETSSSDYPSSHDSPIELLIPTSTTSEYIQISSINSEHSTSIHPQPNTTTADEDDDTPIDILSTDFDESNEMINNSDNFSLSHIEELSNEDSHLSHLGDSVYMEEADCTPVHESSNCSVLMNQNVDNPSSTSSSYKYNNRTTFLESSNSMLLSPELLLDVEGDNDKSLQKCSSNGDCHELSENFIIS
ncbi:Rfx [Strongyloides ratti]|uniref:Rfx n=1 Tax=Strongyloides ratti TaxID=34506 RepID=A0A090N110_STRRB|nr:Rfx [Strongyloides ratti]CEF71623.1 Rfx [Strongyloides ratti]